MIFITLMICVIEIVCFSSTRCCQVFDAEFIPEISKQILKKTKRGEGKMTWEMEQKSYRLIDNSDGHLRYNSINETWQPGLVQSIPETLIRKSLVCQLILFVPLQTINKQSIFIFYFFFIIHFLFSLFS